MANELFYEKKVTDPCIEEAVRVGLGSKLCDVISGIVDCTLSFNNHEGHKYLVAKSAKSLDAFTVELVKRSYSIVWPFNAEKDSVVHEKKVAGFCIGEAMNLGILPALCKELEKRLNCHVHYCFGDCLLARSTNPLDGFTFEFVKEVFDTVKKIAPVLENTIQQGVQRDRHFLPSRTDIMMPWAATRLGLVYAEGDRKYGRYNFMLGGSQASMLNHAMDHFYKWVKGTIDPSVVGDEDDLAKVVWNFMCILDQDERIKLGLLPTELDDLGVKEKAK